MPLYLILDIAAIAIPMAFSFESRIQFYKKWKSLFISVFIVRVAFVLWDSYFTKQGVWGFNPKYLSGFYIFNLPVEEYLFFICVPYSSVFTYYVFKTLMPQFSINDQFKKRLIVVIASTLLIAGMVYFKKQYTCSTMLFGAFTLYIALLFFPSLLSHFILSFCAILIPFFLMNGILTGTFIDSEIVWYNNNENLGLRLLTIPLEDIFYGMSLILWNIMLTEFFQERKSIKREKLP